MMTSLNEPKHHNGSKFFCNIKKLYFIPGENVLRTSNLINSLLVLTGFRLYFIYRNANIEKSMNKFCHMSIPLNLISKIETLKLNDIRVITKIGGCYVLVFTSTVDCSSWSQMLTQMLQPAMEANLFSLHYFAGITVKSSTSDQGFQHVNFVRKEFERMKFGDSWKITDVNKDFEVCPSYPQLHIVPASLNDDDIRGMAEFRANKRFPSVVWRSKLNGAVLIRSAQPRAGLLGWRNSCDENYFKEVMKCLMANEVMGAKKWLVIDARSYKYAMLNGLFGGGVEFSKYYEDAEIMFMGLENMHCVRNSFELISRSICNSESLLTDIEKSCWLVYISQLLKSASYITRALKTDCRPVIIHCSDGWDRTPQLTSLTQILLDKYYRSIEGFQILIEKEWLHFGHKFEDRCGFIEAVDCSERSPVFLQWLECVHQLIVQFPRFFEFNDTFLIKLAIHAHSGLFGDFLYNTEQERLAKGIHHSSASIWTFLSLSNERVINPLYYRYSPDENFSVYERVIYPDCNKKILLPWYRLFFEALNPLDCYLSSSLDYESTEMVDNHHGHDAPHELGEREVFSCRKTKSESDLSSVTATRDKVKRFSSHGHILSNNETEKSVRNKPTNQFIYPVEIPVTDDSDNSRHSSNRSSFTMEVGDGHSLGDQYFRTINLEDGKQRFIDVHHCPCDVDALYLSPEPINQLRKYWTSKSRDQEQTIARLREKIHTLTRSHGKRYKSENCTNTQESDGIPTNNQSFPKHFNGSLNRLHF